MAIDTNTISLAGATGAYRAASLMKPAAPAASSFQDMLEKVALQTLETVREGDRAAVQGLNGQMPIQAVVEATMEMETALSTTVALRDKLVEAYQEVLRMSV